VSVRALTVLARRTTCDVSAPIRASDTRASVALRAGDPVEARNARGGQAVQGERLGRREVVEECPAPDGQVPDELVRREAEDERLAGSLDGADPRVGVGKLPGPLDVLAV